MLQTKHVCSVFHFDTEEYRHGLPEDIRLNVDALAVGLRAVFKRKMAGGIICCETGNLADGSV